MKRLADLRSVFLIVLFGGLFALAARNVTDPDLWWHLKTGQLILENHAIPHTDSFSYTRAGHGWITHEWLSEIFIYKLWCIAGWAGLIITFAAITCAAFFILFIRCRANVYVAGLVTLWAALATRPLWGPRPQIISLSLTALWLLILERSEENPKLLWWSLPILLLWVNLHAGFALGLAFSALFVAGEWLDGSFTGTKNSPRLGFSALILLVDLLVVPLNPNGTKLYFYPIETLHSTAMQSYIAEWASPNFHRPEYWPFLTLILAAFVVVCWSRSRVRPRDLLLLVLTLVASLRSIRLIPAFILIASPLVARWVEIWLISRPFTPLRLRHKMPTPMRRLLHGTILIFTTAFIGLEIRQVVQQQPAVEMQAFPVRAISFLQKHPPSGHLFNNYDWGGYIIWKLYPCTKVFIDGRADLYKDAYGDALLHHFADAYELKDGWRDTLRRWQVQAVLIPPTSALAAGLRESAEWSVLYEDRQAILFTAAHSNLPEGNSPKASLGSGASP